MKIIILFISIFLLSLVIRLAYVRTYQPQILPDTYGYYLIGQRITSGQLPIFNPQRTPGYPLFLQVTYAMTGAQKSEINSVGFWRGAGITTFIQSALSALGVTLLTWLFYQLTKYSGIALERTNSHSREIPRQARDDNFIFIIILNLLLASNILTFSWDSLLVVESLSTSWLALSSIWLFITLIKPTKFKILTLIIFGWLGFLLKPVFLGLPIIWFFLHGLSFRVPMLIGARNLIHQWISLPAGRQVTLHIPKFEMTLSKSILIFILLPLFYILINWQTVNYPGINHVQDINLLGRVIKDKLGPKAGEKIAPELTKKLSEYQNGDNPKDPYTFLQSADPTLLTDDTRQADRNRLKPWVNTIILSNLPQYVWGVIKDLPTALYSYQMEKYELGIMNYGFISSFHKTLITILTPIILLLIFPAFNNWRKKISMETSIILILHLTIWYMLVATVAFGYGEYARLLTPIQPVVYFLGVWWVNSFLSSRAKPRQTRRSRGISQLV